MTALTVPPWDGQDLAELLRLDRVTATHLRSRCAERNTHDRIYGGQLLGQALIAAADKVPAGRAMTTMQFLFLQGALPDEAIDIHVTRLQEGKRFSSRHVRGAQSGGRTVFDAQVSFAPALVSPAHMAAPDPLSIMQEDPEALPCLSDLPRAWADEIDAALGYGLGDQAVADFRLPDPPEGLRLTLPEPRLRFWIKTRQSLPDDRVLHSAAFAYLSDWWLNYASVGGHLASLGPGKSLYVASLNHAIWLHRPLRADDWLHFDCVSPSSGDGRSLTVARVHDRRGQLVASATQECLMAQRHA